MMFVLLSFLSLTQQLVLSQDYTDECPVDNGFFADALQCDRYYECKDGVVSFVYLAIYSIDR